MSSDTLYNDTSELNIIFIHSSLDDVGLTPAEFRIFAHLARRSNEKTGKAYPGIDSMSKICKMHKETAIEAVRELERRNMILVERAPGKGSKYTLTGASKWVVGNGERSEMGNGVVGNGERNQSEMGNERLSNKGNPKKSVSERGMDFANWFNTLLPKPIRKTNTEDLKKWAACYDDLLRLDRREPAEIARICKWARADNFWAANFLSPLKLRKKNNEGVSYFDFFHNKIHHEKTNTNGARSPGATRNTQANSKHSDFAGVGQIA